MVATKEWNMNFIAECDRLTSPQGQGGFRTDRSCIDCNILYLMNDSGLYKGM